MSRRDEARIAHRAYTVHVKACGRCVGRLCPTGRRLKIDADAADWRADNLPEMAGVRS